MQTLLEKSRTYSTGSELMRLKCSDDWWSKVLRKSVNLEYVDINFNITWCDSFNRVWRQYKVSEKGKEFLRRPRNDLVRDSAVDPFNEEKKEKTRKNLLTHVLYTWPESGYLHQQADWVLLRPEPEMAVWRLTGGTGSKRLTWARGIEDIGKQTRSDSMETVRPGTSRSNSPEVSLQKYLSSMRRDKGATLEMYVILKAMTRKKRATYVTLVVLRAIRQNKRATLVTSVVL